MDENSGVVGKMLAQIGGGLLHLVAGVAKDEGFAQGGIAGGPPGQRRNHISQSRHRNYFCIQRPASLSLYNAHLADPILQIALGHARGVGHGGGKRHPLHGPESLPTQFPLAIAAHRGDAPQQALQMIAPGPAIEEVDFVDDDSLQFGQRAGRPRQQRVGGLGRGDQHRRRIRGRDRAGVAAFHAQRDAQLRQGDAQPLVQVAHQGLGGRKIEDADARTPRLFPGQMSLQQRSDGGLGLARSGGGDDQGVASFQRRGDSLLLHRSEAAMPGEERGPCQRQSGPKFSGSGLRHAPTCFFNSASNSAEP